MIKKIAVFSVLAALLAALAGCGAGLPRESALVGRGGYAVVEASLAPFTRIEIKGMSVSPSSENQMIGLTLAPNSGEYGLRIEAQAQIADDIAFAVEDGCLKVTSLSGRPYRFDNAVVRVTFDTLDNLTLAGAYDVTSETPLVPGESGEVWLRFDGAGKLDAAFDTPVLMLALEGSMRASLTGRATKLEVIAGGSSQVDALGLTSMRATVKYTGAGEVLVNAAEQLDVTLSGVGSVRYLGDPEVRRTLRGVGVVERIAE